jgi:hypothetical protein
MRYAPLLLLTLGCGCLDSAFGWLEQPLAVCGRLHRLGSCTRLHMTQSSHRNVVSGCCGSAYSLQEHEGLRVNAESFPLPAFCCLSAFLSVRCVRAMVYTLCKSRIHTVVNVYRTSPAARMAAGQCESVCGPFDDWCVIPSASRGRRLCACHSRHRCKLWNWQGSSKFCHSTHPPLSRSCFRVT